MKINQINVNGTDYDVAIPGSAYPIIAVQGTGGSDTAVVMNSNDAGNYAAIQNIGFAWKRTGDCGAYEYSLVIFTGESAPSDFDYVAADVGGAMA